MAYNLYREGHNDGWRQGVVNGYAAAALVIMWILHEQFGYGQKRLSRVVHTAMRFAGQHILLRAEKNRDGKYMGLDFNDIMQVMQDELGLHMNLQEGSYYFVDKKGNKGVWVPESEAEE